MLHRFWNFGCTYIDLYFKVVMEDTFELDKLIKASSGSATILDIITASGVPLPFTKESSAEASIGKQSEVTCCITKCSKLLKSFFSSLQSIF